jgi:hypothetical protein
MTDLGGGDAGDQGEAVAPKTAADCAGAVVARVRRRKVGIGRVFLAVLEVCLLVFIWPSSAAHSTTS